MDFARRQLLKYGWKEGKGLGKAENGIAEALKPTLKFDTTGVGFDNSEQYTFNWWENVYNEAADNIKVVKSDDGDINVKLNSEESIDITTKKYKRKKKKNLEYGCFVKTNCTLTPSGVVEYKDKIADVVDDESKHMNVSNLTDEALFAVCGGRTAHKGARHGLKLNGKLSRIEEQEIKLLNKMKKEAKKMLLEENSLENNNLEINIEVYKKKKSKKRKRPQTENEDEMDLVAAQKINEYYISKQERRKRRKIKRKEKKRITKLTNMLENVRVSTETESKDDGFDENTKTINEDIGETVKKRHKKKRKLNNETAKNSEDDGFEEYISEVNEKLMYYKELRKDLQKEKEKGDEKRIDEMVEDFESKL